MNKAAQFDPTSDALAEMLLGISYLSAQQQRNQIQKTVCPSQSVQENREASLIASAGEAFKASRHNSSLIELPEK